MWIKVSALRFMWIMAYILCTMRLLDSAYVYPIPFINPPFSVPSGNFMMSLMQSSSPSQNKKFISNKTETKLLLSVIPFSSICWKLKIVPYNVGAG